MLYLGVHASIHGGLIEAKDETEKVGGNCMQIFTGSPQSLNLGKIYELNPESCNVNVPSISHVLSVLTVSTIPTTASNDASGKISIS